MGEVEAVAKAMLKLVLPSTLSLHQQIMEDQEAMENNVVCNKATCAWWLYI